MKELKILKRIKMTEGEKKSLFARIQKSVQGSREGAGADLRYPEPSPFYRFYFFPHTAFMKAGVMAVLILGLTSATAYASLGALPGDILYGVKVNVVEKVATVGRSPEAKAKAETKLIEKRIEELAILADQGELTEENAEKIEADIDEKFENFGENVRQLKAEAEIESKLELEEKLEEKLEEHQEKIKEIQEHKEAQAEKALERVLEKVESKEDELEIEMLETAEDKIEQDILESVIEIDSGLEGEVGEIEAQAEVEAEEILPI